eukprot:5848652-Pyramimonas_sp.AAC.1
MEHVASCELDHQSNPYAQVLLCGCPQGLLIAMSKANNIKYEYSYTSANCTMTNQSEKVLSAPMLGIVFAIIMALLSGAAGVYTELIMKKRPSRNVNVQNIYLYVFGKISANVLLLT